MVRSIIKAPAWPVVALALAALPATAATPPAKATSPEQSWRAECSACHVPYPARLLPASDWQAVMQTLPKHFGVDASLDSPTEQAIRQYLLAHAGPARVGKDEPADPRRISQQGWFVHEHRGARWPTLPSGAKRSFANCDACHAGASAGRFDEEEEGERGERRNRRGGRDDD